MVIIVIEILRLLGFPIIRTLSFLIIHFNFLWKFCIAFLFRIKFIHFLGLLFIVRQHLIVLCSLCFLLSDNLRLLNDKLLFLLLWHSLLHLSHLLLLFQLLVFQVKLCKWFDIIFIVPIEYLIATIRVVSILQFLLLNIHLNLVNGAVIFYFIVEFIVPLVWLVLDQLNLCRHLVKIQVFVAYLLAVSVHVKVLSLQYLSAQRLLLLLLLLSLILILIRPLI